MNLKSAIASLSLALSLALAPLHLAAAPVLELFTSQGCSSCPDADKLARQLADNNPELIVLAFHVDYWDYLGWKDTFASPVFSARQYAYAHKKGSKQVFTPQAIVGGSYEFSGTDAGGISAAIQTAKMDDAGVGAMIEQTPAGFDVVLDAHGNQIGKVDVFFVSVIPDAEVAVERGENAGKRLIYTDIVREIHRVAQWDGLRPLKVTVPNHKGMEEVLFLQAPGQGAIRGAFRLP